MLRRNVHGTYALKVDICEARYVRVQADINPEAGGFLFTDEFVVK